MSARTNSDCFQHDLTSASSKKDGGFLKISFANAFRNISKEMECIRQQIEWRCGVKKFKYSTSRLLEEVD